jgi:hypothetical protein
MKSGRVLCKVGTTVWYIISTNVSTLSGSAMLHVVGSRSFTMENRVRSRVSPSGIRGGLSDTLTGFSPSTLVLPCQYHSHQRSIRIFIFTMFLSKEQACEIWEPSNDDCPIAQSFKRETFADWPRYFRTMCFQHCSHISTQSCPIISPILQNLSW